MKNINNIIKEYNNKGPKFRLSILEKDISEYKSELPGISDDILEDLYLVKEKISSIPLCPVCNLNKKFKTYKKGYYTTCGKKKCLNKYTADRIKSSFKEKYGVENPSELKSVQLKREETCFKKYGVKNPYQVDKVKEDIKSAHLKKYGVEHHMKSKEVKDKLKSTMVKRYGIENAYQLDKVLNVIKERYGDNFGFGSEYFKSKSKETNLERYGYEEFLESPEIQKTISETMNELHGGRGMESEEIRKKIEKTNLEKYGNIVPSKTTSVKNKSIETCLKKYGERHHMQNIEIFEKNSKAAYKWKQVKLPSGRVESVQGYEPQAINELLENGYSEDDIIIANKDIESYTGKIYYIDGDKKRRYYPDIYIKSENKIIEVKSKWTYESHLTINNLKRAACLELGLLFEFNIIEK